MILLKELKKIENSIEKPLETNNKPQNHQPIQSNPPVKEQPAIINLNNQEKKIEKKSGCC